MEPLDVIRKVIGIFNGDRSFAHVKSNIFNSHLTQEIQVLTLSVETWETWISSFANFLLTWHSASRGTRSQSHCRQCFFLDNPSVLFVHLTRFRDVPTLRPFALRQSTRRNRRKRGLSSPDSPSTREVP